MEKPLRSSGGSVHQKEISNEEVRLGEKVGPECSRETPSS